MFTILVVDDEEDILELLSYNLRKYNFNVITATTGEEGLKLALAQKPNLILLDVMLPGIDGIHLCKILKNNPKTQRIPVILLTAKNEEADIVYGLESGADDYVTKPFSPKVLIARINAALRRKSENVTDKNATIYIKELEINPGRHEVLINGKPVVFTYTEFQILYLLASRPGWVFSRDSIVETIKGEDYLVTDRSVDVQIVSIRKKLGEYEHYIETVRGVGYRFKE